MRKAYIIIAHKNPGHLHRLVSRLNDGKSDFFIHIDRKVDLSLFQKLGEFGNIIHWTERFDSKWGSYGTIKPYISAMWEIRNMAVNFDRIMLISGQDYPIKSNADIDKFFMESPYSAFINYFPIPNFDKWPGSDRGGLYRVDKYYFGSEKMELFCSRAMNFLANYIHSLKRKIPNGMKPYTGQTWWNMDMYTLNYILDYNTAHPEYLHFHRNTFVADEVFVQMIIGNSTDENLLQRIENSEKRFTIWEKASSAHPKILDKNDFDAINASDDLFARKFEEADTEILDMIDSRILLSNT